ncbi:MAG TPA: polyprenyl synthetase family protein, partial [Longimicrobiales bacterium]|nr:polyprenyl synthetase family protein [Longimicrobiales bacterium]
EERALDLAALEAVHGAKTGALLTGALRLGARAAGAEDQRLDAITRYGRSLGLAFQIADDVLDVVSESAILGKPAGSDLALGKSTYPALLGVAGARQRAREEVDKAVAALRAGGLATPELEALAAYAVERER